MLLDAADTVLGIFGFMSILVFYVYQKIEDRKKSPIQFFNNPIILNRQKSDDSDKASKIRSELNEAKKAIISESESYRKFANESFVGMFIIFMIGISLSTIGIMADSEGFTNFVKTYPKLKSIPLIVFTLDIISVGLIGVTSFALWVYYYHTSDIDKKIDEINSEYIL